MDAKAQGINTPARTRSRDAAWSLSQPSAPSNWLGTLKAFPEAGLTGLAVPPLAN